MDVATCCWGAYTCYTWCIGSYTDKKNVSLQATCNVLSFYRWQKTQIVWACVRGESAGIGEKLRGFSKPPTPVWPIGEASCDLTEAPTSPARAFPQAITSELVLQTSSIIHAPVQRSLKSYFTKHSDKPGRQQSVTAVHRNSLNISCSLYFLGNEGGIHLDWVVAAYITVYLHAFNANSLKELCKSSNNKNTPSKYLLNAICVAQCLKLQAGFERSVD